MPNYVTHSISPKKKKVPKIMLKKILITKVTTLEQQ